MGTLTTDPKKAQHAHDGHFSAGKVVALGAATAGVIAGAVAVNNAVRNGNVPLSPESVERLGTPLQPGPEDGKTVKKQFPGITVTHRRYDNSIQHFDSLDVAVARDHSIENIEVGAGGVNVRYHDGEIERFRITPMEGGQQPTQIVITRELRSMEQTQQADGTVLFSDRLKEGAAALPAVKYKDDGEHSVSITFRNLLHTPLSGALELGDLPKPPRQLNIAAENTGLAISGMSNELMKNIRIIDLPTKDKVIAFYPTTERNALAAATLSLSRGATAIVKWPEGTRNEKGEPATSMVFGASSSSLPRR